MCFDCEFYCRTNGDEIVEEGIGQKNSPLLVCGEGLHPKNRFEKAHFREHFELCSLTCRTAKTSS